MAKSKIIVHLTSVHTHDDVRIFYKECCSLAKEGYEVHLVVPESPNGLINGVHLHNVPISTGGRLSRMTKTVYSVFRVAVSIEADLYHFHDPELLPAGLLLKLRGKRVVYDAHEDLPRQLLSKSWIHSAIRKPLSWLFELFEDTLARRLDAVVTATPHIEARFNRTGCRALAINNFPNLAEFDLVECNWKKKAKAVCYAGGITVIRGIREMVIAVGIADAKLLLAGEFSPVVLRKEIVDLPEWESVEECGQLDRKAVVDLLSRSVAGLVILHPILNYIDSLPVKMFEYMSAGIPVIASNFPLWREIVEGNGCGLCVDPLDPRAIAMAIDYLIQNPDTAQSMGANGRQAVLQKYNWAVEEQKLLDLYVAILN